MLNTKCKGDLWLQNDIVSFFSDVIRFCVLLIKMMKKLFIRSGCHCFISPIHIQYIMFLRYEASVKNKHTYSEKTCVEEQYYGHYYYHYYRIQKSMQQQWCSNSNSELKHHTPIKVQTVPLLLWFVGLPLILKLISLFSVYS